MAKCLNEGCENEVVLTEGRRPRKTCSARCRQKVFHKNKQEKHFIRLPIDEYEKLVTSAIGNEMLGKAISASVRMLPERDNPLINAARGRDESGINDDEMNTAPEFDHEIEKTTIPVQIKKNREFRAIMKGESGLDYSIAKREFLNNQ